MPPVITATIGGVSVPSIEQASFSIETVIGATVDTAKLRIYDKAANLAIQEEVDVIIQDSASNRIFGGLSSMVDGWVEGRSRWWDVSCQDYTILLDTTIVLASYPAGYTYDGLSGDQAIIANLFEQAVVGLTGGSSASEIEARTYVGQALSGTAAMTFNYVTLREAMATICGYTGWNYYVDYEKHLHYYFREDVAAPYNLSSSPNGSTTLGYRNLKWKRDGTSIRNFYLMFGVNLFSDAQTYIFPGDGSKTVFLLGITELERNVILAGPEGYQTIRVYTNTGTDGTPIWTEATVGLEGADAAGSKDCLHNPAQQVLTFTTAPPNLANSVKVIGRYLFNAAQANTDNNSINKYGRAFARRLVAADTNSAAALNNKLISYRTQFAFALNKCTLKVDEATFPGTSRFQVGQWVNLYNEILGINKGFLISRITTNVIGGSYKDYNLELRDWFTDQAV